VNIPIVTLDKIFVQPDEKNIYFLDCTRINNSNEIVGRKNQNIDKQIENLAKVLPNKIILMDDVIFSGNVIRYIIERFYIKRIEVVSVYSSICSNNAYSYFNTKLKYGVKTNYLMMYDVIDQVCERDFYYGIAGSGIMISINNNLYKMPYFKPFGKPYERASIPNAYEKYFSYGCLNRSIYLWDEIDMKLGRNTLNYELPEKIVNVNEYEEVVKTLKKEIRRL